MWLTQGYGHLNFKAPLLFWEQLNYTENNQPSNTRKLGWEFYGQCHYIISLKDKDWYRTD